MAILPDLPLPPDLNIGPSYTLRVLAMDPTTGAVNGSVNVGTVVITSPNAADAASGDFVVANPILLGIGI